MFATISCGEVLPPQCIDADEDGVCVEEDSDDQNAFCGADATAFAFIAGGLPDLFDSPVQKKLAATPNLVAYRDRMMAEFFPAFAKAG